METNNNNGNLNKLKEIENDCVAKYTELLNLLKGNYIRMQPLRLPFMPERTLYCYGIFTALHPALESVVPRIRDEWPTLGAFDLLVHEQSIKTALIRAYEGFSEENKMQLARFMEQHYSHCTEELMKTKAFQFANKGQVEQFVETWTDKWMERFVMENGNFGVPDLNAARTQLECDGVLKWKKEYLDKAMEMVRERQRKTVEHFYEEVDTKMRSSEVLKACLTSGEFGQEVYPDEQLVEWLKPYISKAVDEFIMDSSGKCLMNFFRK